ncbi:MAG: TonB-dependent receptor [Bacteroidales bacterium]|nr:TonB-dependent receptor [Bacteroidales bacterium]
MRKNIFLFVLLAIVMPLSAQQTDTSRTSQLHDVTIQARRSSGVQRMGGAENGSIIGQDELFRAACCNLGESFVTNPSVDVNYDDAAVGARQIKLLGLSGRYAQMLIEGLPMSGGASQPYLLGYVPGAWMQSIQVSKGAASVKNGFQSTTGQIDIEFIKPDRETSIDVNLYANSRAKVEGNIVANININKALSTELLLHSEHDFMHHDANHDDWIDLAGVTQHHVQNRWKYRRGRYIMHAGVGVVDEQRIGGQSDMAIANPFNLGINARRHEAYMKHALLIDRAHNSNIALMAVAHRFDLDGTFGNKKYFNNNADINSQLIFEHEFTEEHQLSAGLSYSFEHNVDSLNLLPEEVDSREHTVGAYAQYTFQPSPVLTLMAGMRADNSSLFGFFFTPRLHVKLMLTDRFTLRMAAGRAARTAHSLAENHFLLASARFIPTALTMREEAWNAGASAMWLAPIGDRTIKINAEYYHTWFTRQSIVDYYSDPLNISIIPLDGSSFSNTLQIDASMQITDNLETTIAYRLNDVRCTYGDRLLPQPLTSRYKTLFTLAWRPMMALWHVDVTLQINGGGRMPDAYPTADGSPSWEDDTFPAFAQLNAQLTREFRHFSVYVGGENLTNYIQPNLVVDATNPWLPTFDPTMVWGPVHGIVGYVGIRFNFAK